MTSFFLLLASGSDAAGAGGIGLVEIALVIFFAVFVAVTAWVLLVRKGGFNDQARIPLQDEPVNPRDPHPHQHDRPRNGRPEEAGR